MYGLFQVEELHGQDCKFFLLSLGDKLLLYRPDSKFTPLSYTCPFFKLLDPQEYCSFQTLMFNWLIFCFVSKGISLHGNPVSKKQCTMTILLLLLEEIYLMSMAFVYEMKIPVQSLSHYLVA